MLYFKKIPSSMSRGFFIIRCLAVTYFYMRNAHYHRRNFVSRPCSRWEGVGPKRYSRQAKLLEEANRLNCITAKNLSHVFSKPQNLFTILGSLFSTFFLKVIESSHTVN